MAAAAANIPRISVLYAEDDPFSRDILISFANTYSKCIYTCKIVSDGAQAVDESTRHEYDVILMDYHMPDSKGHEGLNGSQAARAIKELAAKNLKAPMHLSSTSAEKNDPELGRIFSPTEINRSKPIIIGYSGDDNEEIIQNFQNAGCAGYLIKPHDDLFNTITSILEQIAPDLFRINLNEPHNVEIKAKSHH